MIFKGCETQTLKHVDLAEGVVHETIAALQLEEWRNDMYEEIDSINQILPNATDDDIIPTSWEYDRHNEDEDKAQVIRIWIRSVLGKIVHYTAEYRRLMDEEVAPILRLALPQDFMLTSVLSFLKLPSHTFRGGNDDQRRS